MEKIGWSQKKIRSDEKVKQETAFGKQDSLSLYMSSFQFLTVPSRMNRGKTLQV